MTRAVYQSMYVSLSALLLAVLFVFQPTQVPELKEFQLSVKQQFVAAAEDVIGNQNAAEPFVAIWESVNLFFEASADQTIALMQDDDLTNLALMFNSDYLLDNNIANSPQIVAVGFEEPLMNIVPMGPGENLLDPYFNEDLAYDEQFGGIVAGDSITVDPDAVEEVAVVWMTINDSITGYPYCVGIFNGTINSYPGVCAVETNTSNNVYEN